MSSIDTQVAAIKQRATDIAKKSTSASVDLWAGEIITLVDQIVAIVNQNTITIVERRSGTERRLGKDVAGGPQRRVAERRVNPWLVEVN